MTQALVSVIIPTYNRAHLVGETIDSVRAQTYPHWECLVVDDGSTDETRELVTSLAEQEGTGRIHLLVQENAGAPRARNHGFEKSRGEFIQFLDSDDLIDEIKLASQVEALESTGTEIAYCAWCEFHDHRGRRIHSRNYSDGPIPGGDHLAAELRGWHPAPNAYLYRREAVELLGLWDEQLAQNQDIDFAFRIGLAGFQPIFTPGRALHREHRGDRISEVTNDQTIRSRKRVFQKLEKALKESGKWEAYRPDLACLYTMYALQAVPHNRELALSFLKRAREIGKPRAPIRGGWFAIAWRLLGPLMAGRLLGWSQRLRKRRA